MANLNISQFPLAGPLTGAELIGVMQAGVTKQTTAAQLNNSAVSALPLGSRSLSLKTANFANVTAGAPMLANYQFGSAAGSGPGITPVRNLTDLTNNFNAFEDFTLQTSINSELERYQPFNTANHVFATDGVTLQVVNPGNDWQCTAITQISGTVAIANATPMTIASLGLPDTSNVQLLQMVAVQGGGGLGGLYYVSAMVPNVSVSLTPLQGSTTGTTNAQNFPQGLIFWLPIVGAKLASPYVNGAPSMNFTALPAFVKVGQAVAVNAVPLGAQTLNRSADTRVTVIAGNLVSISPVGANLPNIATGVIVWFFPVITSGQIWSKLQIDLTNQQTFYAIEADLTLLNSITTRTVSSNNGYTTLAAFNAFPSTTPLGGWPAFWCFSADDGNSAQETSSASEIDYLEIQVGCTQDIGYLNTGDASYTGSATLFTKNDSGWGSFAAFGIAIAPAGTNFVGRNLYQFIFTNGAAYRFFNGILYSVKQFAWTGQRPLQFSVGIAAGGMTPPLAMNTIFPNKPAGFANMQATVHGIKVWYQAPGG